MKDLGKELRKVEISGSARDKGDLIRIFGDVMICPHKDSDIRLSLYKGIDFFIVVPAEKEMKIFTVWPLKGAELEDYDGTGDVMEFKVGDKKLWVFMSPVTGRC